VVVIEIWYFKIKKYKLVHKNDISVFTILCLITGYIVILMCLFPYRHQKKYGTRYVEYIFSIFFFDVELTFGDSKGIWLMKTDGVYSERYFFWD